MRPLARTRLVVAPTSSGPARTHQVGLVKSASAGGISRYRRQGRGGGYVRLAPVRSDLTAFREQTQRLERKVRWLGQPPRVTRTRACAREGMSPNHLTPNRGI